MYLLLPGYHPGYVRKLTRLLPHFRGRAILSAPNEQAPFEQIPIGYSIAWGIIELYDSLQRRT